MEERAFGEIRGYEGERPTLGEDAFVAPGAEVIGDVTLGEEASVWYNCVLRGDVEPITVGDRSNIQDLTVVHGTGGEWATEVGADVTVGHRAILHGCRIEERALVGMGATLLDGVVVGEEALVGANALLTPGTEVPPGAVALGSPAEIVRDVTDREREEFAESAIHYADLADRHAASSGE